MKIFLRLKKLLKILNQCQFLTNKPFFYLDKHHDSEEQSKSTIDFLHRFSNLVDIEFVFLSVFICHLHLFVHVILIKEDTDNALKTKISITQLYWPVFCTQAYSVREFASSRENQLFRSNFKQNLGQIFQKIRSGLFGTLREDFKQRISY